MRAIIIKNAKFAREAAKPNIEIVEKASFLCIVEKRRKEDKLETVSR